MATRVNNLPSLVELRMPRLKDERPQFGMKRVRIVPNDVVKTARCCYSNAQKHCGRKAGVEWEH